MNILPPDDCAFSEYLYYKGEKENPYAKNGESVLDFQNPKSLFWYYEHHFYHSRNSGEKLEHFIENLIHNKLSEYTQSDYKLWEMYFNSAIK